MDNSRYYTSVASYDYSLFESDGSAARDIRRTERRAEIRKMPIRKQSRKPKKSRVAATVFAVVFLFAIISAEIYLRAEITGVKEETDETIKVIRELDSRETGLEMQIEQRTAYENLREKAEELGLQKPERDQIIYLEPDK